MTAAKADPVDQLLAILADKAIVRQPVPDMEALLVGIATNPDQSSKLIAAVAAGPGGRNDPKLAETVKDLLGRLAIRIEQSADKGQSTVDVIDKYGWPLAGIITTAGFGGVLLGTFVAAPFVLAAGLVGLAAAATSRILVNDDVIDDKAKAKLVKHLQGMLK